jgi:hypothetical protein
MHSSEEEKHSIPPPDFLLKAVAEKYPGAIQKRDAIITPHGFVFKMPTKMLIINQEAEEVDMTTYVNFSTTDLSQVAVYKEGLMLLLGRCFLGDIFPEVAFEEIGKKILLRTKFIIGKPFGINYLEVNPERFITDLAQLTTIMVLFRNSDLYADNLIVSPDASIHGIDLVECGKQLFYSFNYTVWGFRKFNSEINKFEKIAFPPELLKKLQQYSDLYCKEVHKAIELIRSKIEKAEDKACIKNFYHLMNYYNYISTVDNEEKRKFLDMNWYEESRKNFLDLAKKSSFLNKYQLFYPDIHLSLEILLEKTVILAAAYESAEYDKIRLEKTKIFYIKQFNLFDIHKIKFKVNSYEYIIFSIS